MNEQNYKAYKKIRRTWNISPIEKVKESNKRYDRNKSKNDFKKILNEDIENI